MRAEMEKKTSNKSESEKIIKIFFKQLKTDSSSLILEQLYEKLGKALNFKCQ
jgi:hypothetical protein